MSISKVDKMTIPVPWTNVYGTGRTFVALSTLITLLCNRSSILFTKSNLPEILSIHNSVFIKYNFFKLNSHTEVLRGISVIILLLVVIGWRPRYTALFHTYIAFSFMFLHINIDGGDQVAAILSLLLLPIAIFDPRSSHFDHASNKLQNPYVSLFSYSALIMIRIQMSIIYLIAATSKFNVGEWVDGTAIWYWVHDPIFGPTNFVASLIVPLLKNPFIITFVCWGTILLELLLFMALTMPKNYRKILLALGILFHFFIFVTHGLFSFSLVMYGGLILYLRPIEEVFFQKATCEIKCSESNF